MNNKLKGFTLAEVLIALVILGVIAAVTIPNLISNYQKKTTVVRLRKFYSALESAYSQYLSENPNPVYFEQGAETSKKAFDALIKPYFNIYYNAGTNTTNKQKIMYSNGYKKGVNTNDTTIDYSSNTNYAAAKLKDGSVVWLRGLTPTEISNSNNNGYVVSLFIDVNGKKSPNIAGVDTFSFTLNKDGTIGPSGTNITNSIERCATQSSSFGLVCGGWVIFKGNMNYVNCPDNADANTGNCK